MMSFGERIRITKRGFGILRKYCPGLSEQKALYEFIHSLQPFITIWFSARIVDELTNHCRKDYIASYVICVISINFICIVFQNVLLHICNEKESQMWIWFEKVFSDKQMSLDYDDLEDVSIQKQRQEVEENLFMFGNGLAQLVWGTSVMVKVFVNIFVALLMSGTLFISKTGEKIVDHPIWIVAILGCITLCGFSNYKATRK